MIMFVVGRIITQGLMEKENRDENDIACCTKIMELVLRVIRD